MPNTVHAAWWRCGGWVLHLAWTSDGLCYLGLPGSPDADLDRFIGRWLPGFSRQDEAEPPPETAHQLTEYFEGARTDFDLVLDVRGTAFQIAVWRSLLTIPYGQTRTYGEIAGAVGRPGGARAVGQALGQNPLPIVLPCHRVLARDGMGGFGGGLPTKMRLLAIEGVA